MAPEEQQHPEETETFYGGRGAHGRKVWAGKKASANGGLSRCEKANLICGWGMRPEFRTKQTRRWKEYRQVAEPPLPLLVENRFSQDLGTGLGESTSATTAVAPVLDGQVRTLIMNHLHVVH